MDLRPEDAHVTIWPNINCSVTRVTDGAVTCLLHPENFNLFQGHALPVTVCSVT